jgi:BMFP domain-containing protein YqiC
MENSEKIIKLISSFVENGILSTQDVKKELENNLKFTKDNIVEKLKLVPRREFEILKKIVQKQDKEIKKLKKIKKAKRS